MISDDKVLSYCFVVNVCAARNSQKLTLAAKAENQVTYLQGGSIHIESLKRGR